ncbi:hypothetical protein G6O69_12025 [Pseudenhygromyxa sp. WMMC2535]|uniref:hypothetical protein n=1 Tax=Pseudenhygromyxa sp. WMMC2535 TaxID=2712867 RepID=UPI0015532783|nr:hypothetical protein [Pseudenhygromyxa sp. WMMC2535]NVB38560.1 hypothetical protein [Pseudenhygromyxa sp. WMMC2535]
MSTPTTRPEVAVVSGGTISSQHQLPNGPKVGFLDADYFRGLSAPMRARLEHVGVPNMRSVAELRLSTEGMTEGELESAFDYHDMSVEHGAPLDVVWTAYTSTDPRAGWDGDGIAYAFAYSRATKALYLRASDGVPPQQEGTGFYLDLKVFGLFEMAVGVEISRVDALAKVIEFTYLAGGNTRGRQRMSFREVGGETVIRHETWFRCEGRIRGWLYPAGHARTVAAFHGNVARAGGLGLGSKARG